MTDPYFPLVLAICGSVARKIIPIMDLIFAIMTADPLKQDCLARIRPMIDRPQFWLNAQEKKNLSRTGKDE